MIAPDQTESLDIALVASATFDPETLHRLLRSRDVWLRARASAALAERIGVPLEALKGAQDVAERAEELAAAERQRVARAGVRLLLPGDEDFPPGLDDLDRPPPLLYCRGDLPAAPAIAIVGPRRPDPWALEATRLFASRLAEAGLVVVSGFARGVDRAAHEAALDAPGGRTVAVLGCGLDYDYPRGQRPLQRSIAERGAVLSEFALRAAPRPFFFPIRNRLIAALGWGTLVVQAASRSGSLITARLALELGREVMALPGRVFDRLSAGSNTLIRDGAHCALHPDQILEMLPLALRDRLDEARSAAASPPAGPSAPAAELRGDTLRILRLLARTSDPWSAERVGRELDLPVAEVLARLAELELEGLAKRFPGGRFLAMREGLDSP